MADSTGEKKSPKKKPPKKAAEVWQGTGGSTLKQAQKLALAVIHEYGLPEEIKDQILDAAPGLDPQILEQIGGFHAAQPHGAYGYKRKKKK